MYTLALVGGSILLGPFGPMMLKAGMSGRIPLTRMRSLLSCETLFSTPSNRVVMVGIVVYAVAAVSWLGVLSVSRLSAEYPLLSLNYVLVAMPRTVVLAEDLSLQRWGCIVVTVLDCALVLGERKSFVVRQDDVNWDCQ